ncbi:hypothetical protein Emed_005797 [Eimeria media]
MQARRALQPAARCLGVGLPAGAAAAGPRSLSGCLASSSCCYYPKNVAVVDSWPRARCRFLSTAESAASRESSAEANTIRSLRSWERPLLAEVYRQLRGQHLEMREASPPAAGGPPGGPPSLSVPGWEYTPEDERGLRFGSAYMLLTLAWNPSEEAAAEGEPGEDEAAVKTEGLGSSSARAKEQLHAEALLGRLQGCLGPQLQQLLQQQAAFLAQRGLTLHAVVKPQRVVVDAVYGIVAVLLQHGSLQVLLRRGSNSSSLGAPATLYMVKPRTFDFEAAVAAAETAMEGPQEHEAAARMGAEGGDQEKGNERNATNPEDVPLSAIDKRLQLLNTESLWRKRAREQMQVLLKQPLTFRQFMNMCADCGSALDRGFVIVADFKILCSQQLAILDHAGNVVMGSKDDEAAVHTLRLELNAKFDASNS